MLDETWGISNHTLSYKGKYQRRVLRGAEETNAEKITSFKKQAGLGKIKMPLHPYLI